MTIAVGIVAAVLLPTLALLATGTRMATVSEDQNASSRIAKMIMERIIPIPGTGRYEIVPGNGAAPGFLDVTSSPTFYAAFSDRGDFLHEVEEAVFERGNNGTGPGFYLVSVTLSPAAVETGTLDRRSGLYDLAIGVERPAMAARADREGQFFISRLAAP